MLITENGKVMSFTEWRLSESVAVIETDYGVDRFAQDKRLELIGNFWVSLLLNDTRYYMVGVNKETGSVSFGASGKYSLDPSNYSDDRKQTSNAILVLGKVMFVVFRIALQKRISEISFEGANPALGTVYQRMVNNKFFLNSVRDAGYKFSHEDSRRYIFTEIA